MLKPRIQASGAQYKTGSGQRWTTQYTWEDYVALMSISYLVVTCIPAMTKIWNVYARSAVSKYFEQHPEALLEAEPFKGLTMEEIKIKAMSMSV